MSTDVDDTLQLLGFIRYVDDRWEVPLDPGDGYAIYQDVTNCNLLRLDKFLLVALLRLPKEEIPYMVSHKLVPPGIRIVLLRMLEQENVCPPGVP